MSVLSRGFWGVTLCTSLGGQCGKMGITGFNAAFVPVVGSQSVVPLQAASASPGKILQMQIFNTTPRQKSETLGMGFAACFNKHSR